MAAFSFGSSVRIECSARLTLPHTASMSKPSIPKGTRDFTPEVMARRNWIFSILREAFERRGFQPIETPAMESLATLTGKYGEEGDQLIFKILNNGDFLGKAQEDTLASRDSKALGFQISKKALRYDLTVPFARFVTMHRNDIPMPFKRYQMQTVWRGDRPGKGRYQEFVQCDADIIGSTGVLCELELVCLFHEALTSLRVPQFRILVNDRRILAGVAEHLGIQSRLTDWTVAVDKQDKVGLDGVCTELEQRGFDAAVCEGTRLLFSERAPGVEGMQALMEQFPNAQVAEGVEALSSLWQLADGEGVQAPTLVFAPGLARGLDYYTGAIFEVQVVDAPVGSICGGGRYDDLTGIFGMPGVSGVGISFGADRIYDVLDHFGAFPEGLGAGLDVLVLHMGEETLQAALTAAAECRARGRRTELYPDAAKLKRQFKYADDRRAAHVIIIGSDEAAEGKVTLRNMVNGEQVTAPLAEILKAVEG